VTSILRNVPMLLSNTNSLTPILFWHELSDSTALRAQSHKTALILGVGPAWVHRLSGFMPSLATNLKVYVVLSPFRFDNLLQLHRKHYIYNYCLIIKGKIQEQSNRREP
jgi:hypothetical protein